MYPLVHTIHRVAFKVPVCSHEAVDMPPSNEAAKPVAKQKVIHGISLFHGSLKSFSLQVLPLSGKDHESSSLSFPKTEETFVATFGLLLALPTGACTCKENEVT
jgi:hypothetical protein